MKQRFNCLVAAILVISFSNCTSKTTTSSISVLPILSAEDNKIIIQREISSWEFGKTKNVSGLKEIYADDYTAFFGKSVMNEADVLRTFQNSTIRSYHLSNIRVKPLADNVAVVYYELEQDVVDENGDKWTPFVASSTTYVKRGGTWRAVFYQESEIKN